MVLGVLFYTFYCLVLFSCASIAINLFRGSQVGVAVSSFASHIQEPISNTAGSSSGLDFQFLLDGVGFVPLE